MKVRNLIRQDGILTRWIGGPLDGKLIKVPSLEDVLTVHPEDNQMSRPAGGLKQVHQYVLHQRVTFDGVPTYRYDGIQSESILP